LHGTLCRVGSVESELKRPDLEVVCTIIVRQLYINGLHVSLEAVPLRNNCENSERADSVKASIHQDELQDGCTLFKEEEEVKLTRHGAGDAGILIVVVISASPPPSTSSPGHIN